jgi:hypothetical protein
LEWIVANAQQRKGGMKVITSQRDGDAVHDMICFER